VGSMDVLGVVLRFWHRVLGLFTSFSTPRGSDHQGLDYQSLESLTAVLYYDTACVQAAMKQQRAECEMYFDCTRS
jgi:hypothetical protein